MGSRVISSMVRDGTFSNGVSDYLWTGELPGDDRSRYERYVRLCLRGIKKGPFAVRMSVEIQRGAHQARAFIQEHGLKPYGQR